ncbi:hypothetical protein GCM10023224_50550 [Streptomonospora halophila]|uniref:Secreted protein n=1 Tax=Streptomonospora halophila TaxID=427369 RepID=A0ABP9H066_9ACTN
MVPIGAAPALLSGGTQAVTARPPWHPAGGGLCAGGTATGTRGDHKADVPARPRKSPVTMHQTGTTWPHADSAPICGHPDPTISPVPFG